MVVRQRGITMRVKQQLNKWTQRSLAASIAAGDKRTGGNMVIKRVIKNKLTYENQWESDIYRVNDQEIKSLKKVEINGKVYKVISEKIGIDYNDMGNTYTAVSTHYFVETEVFGIEKQIDLNTLVPKINVIAIEWS